VRSLASKDEGGRMKAENALRFRIPGSGVLIRHVRRVELMCQLVGVEAGAPG